MSSVDFGTLFEFIRNGMNVKQDKSGEGLPISRIETISYGVVDPNRVGYAGLSEADGSDWLLQEGDLLFSHINSAELVGKCAIYTGQPSKLVHGMNLLCLRPRRDCLDSVYAKYLIRSQDFRDKLSAFINKAVNQASVSIGNLRTIQVKVPAVSEQRRIAVILEQAEALRMKRSIAFAKLDTLAQSLFIEMFGKPSDNPMAWPESRLIDICSPKQWPTITATQLTLDGYPVFGANGLIGCYSAYNHEEPTVLITCRGATCGTINVCPPKCYVTGNAMALDSPDPGKVVLEYLEWVLRLRGMADTISGSAQPQITRQGLTPVRVPLPPLDHQALFGDRLRSLNDVKKVQQASLDLAGALSHTLQHRAFKGEL